MILSLAYALLFALATAVRFRPDLVKGEPVREEFRERYARMPPDRKGFETSTSPATLCIERSRGRAG